MFGLFLASCEDPAPTDYKPEYFVEAYLFVDKPIEGLRVTQSQPITSDYVDSIAWVRDAVVNIIGPSGTIQTEFRTSPTAGYYAKDASYKIEPEKEYHLEITLSDGNKITGTTLTPGRTAWIKPPAKELYYPQDTFDLPNDPNLQIQWEPVPGRAYYFVQTDCTDTIDYGKYLSTPTDEKNRRCYNLFSDQPEDETYAYYANSTNWGFIANTKSETVWLAFKWFGKHKLRLYVPDDNMITWFLNMFFTGSSYHDSNFNTVHGDNAQGVFGSAFVMEDELFLYKNQP
jgi:hypothetical protein